MIKQVTSLQLLEHIDLSAIFPTSRWRKNHVMSRNETSLNTQYRC